MGELQIFKNEEFGEVRTILIDGEIWFVGRDIASILGYSDPSATISKKCKHKRKEMISHCQGNKIIKTQTTLINEDDLYELIINSKVESKKYKEDFFKWLKDKKLITNKITFTSRKEIEFLDQLEESLKPFNIKGIRQYNVLSYRIDYYISSLNIAIEYDENNHKDYTYEQHDGRQKEIEKELNCKFIRVSDKNTNGYNIGLVIKEMFNL